MSNELPDNLVRLEPNQNEKETKKQHREEKEIAIFKDKKKEESLSIEQKSLPAKAGSPEEAGASSKSLPKITSIQAQKRKGRYNIFLDGKYAFPVDEALIVKHLLRKGMEVSPDLKRTLQEEDAFRKAYQRALNYLSYGLRSEKEVRDDLAQKEFEEHSDAVIEKLKEQRLIDDVEYAKAYVRTGANLNRKGPKVIANELKRRGIDELKIEEALPEYSEEDQVENAIFLAEKQWRKGKKKSEREAIQYVRQYLMQKGFQSDIINVALEAIDTEKEDEEEYEALMKQGEKAWKRYARKFQGYELEQKIKAYLFQKGYPSELITRFIEEKEKDV